jgi:hypoxanthine phosphoribosyltransferase
LAELRYISWEEYGALADRLSRKILETEADFDLVVGIARGGIPLAMVLADKLGVKLDIVNVKSYTGINMRKKPTIVSTLTENISGKKILIVDDLVDNGDTMETVVEYLKKEMPGSLKTAVLFKKPWSRFEPDFFVEIVTQWIVFPWEREEVRRSMLNHASQELKEG